MIPKVSIVIPVYNTGKYLTKCLESVCAQTLQDIEIICVNDGSTDNSAKILADHAARDERVRVIEQVNSGELAARNSGIQAARGEWIGFVDSDDWISPDMYERLLSNGERTGADISHCGLMFCYPDGHQVPHYGSGMVKEQNHETGLLDLLDGSRIEPSMCCKLYRRELFREFNPAERIRNNGDLYSNIILFDKAQKSIYEDFCGYCYRRNPSSASSDYDSVSSLRRVLSVRRNILDMLNPPIRGKAYELWLSTLVNILNRVSIHNDEEGMSFYRECREKLKEEQKNLSCLSRKQQIAARLHLSFPVLGRLLYRIYGKYSLYRYEH